MKSNEQLNKESSFMDENMIRELAESSQRLNISLTNDFAFKTTFRNKKALKGLLSALLEIRAEEIEELEFQDTFLHGEFPEDKEGILDVKVLLNGDKKLNIEIQVLPFLNWEERSLYYLSRYFIENFRKGEAYKQLNTTIHISILNFNLCEDAGLYSVIGLLDRKTHRLYSDRMSLRVLQLKKLIDATDEEKESDICKWAGMITARDWEVLKNMGNQNEYMKEAVSEMEKINAEKEKRYLYLQREKRLRDEDGVREYARKEGREEGIIEGVKEGVKEGHEQVLTIIEMLQTGKSTGEISDLVGCPEELVKKLLMRLTPEIKP